jgi:L,D-transpeptidase catalytic domain
MRSITLAVSSCVFAFLLSSCSSMGSSMSAGDPPGDPPHHSYMPSHMATGGQKVIVVDPRIHAFGAYGPDGRLLRSGMATAGNSWCPDIHRPCRTRVGSFRIYSLGSFGCKSKIYPRPRGGAPMPYCMYFNGSQGLHGSYEVVNGNISHGCVRLHVSDAEWIRFNFANIGTKVIVRPY